MMTKKPQPAKEAKEPKASPRESNRQPRQSSAQPKQSPEQQKQANTQPKAASGTALMQREKQTLPEKIHKSHVVIKYDCGFSNVLYIRGKGANLNWEKGQPLKNIKNDEWVWETDLPFSSCEFKVLLNDSHFELGDNHILNGGTTVQYTPRF